MNLNFKKHLGNCIKSASYKALLLSKVRRYIAFEAAIRIDKTMILPLIDYGDILYDGSNQVLLKKYKHCRTDVSEHVFLKIITFQ